MMYAPVHWLNAGSHLVSSAQTKSTVKRKLYEEGPLPTSSDGGKKVIKKATATVAIATQGTPTVMVPTAQDAAASGIQRPASSQLPVKKQKTAGEPRHVFLSHVLHF